MLRHALMLIELRHITRKENADMSTMLVDELKTRPVGQRDVSACYLSITDRRMSGLVGSGEHLLFLLRVDGRSIDDRTHLARQDLFGIS